MSQTRGLHVKQLKLEVPMMGIRAMISLKSQKKTTKGDRRPAKKKTAPKNPKEGSRKRGAWNYNETRMEFLTDLKKSGLTFTEAKKEWDNSDKKRELLSTLSLPELKRRKFVPKSCKTHPWA